MREKAIVTQHDSYLLVPEVSVNFSSITCCQ
jgi:hypothetical protein